MRSMNSVSIRFLALVGLAVAAGVGSGGAPAGALAQPAASDEEINPAAPPPAPEYGPQEETPAARQERLDKLFRGLADADEAEAEKIAEEIRVIWGKSGSDSMDLLLNRARKAINAKTFEKARAHLNALTRLAPDFAEGWNTSATLYYLQQDFWRAAVDVEQTLRLEPRHFSALAGLAMILERTGRKEAAIRTWREVERIYPKLDQARKAIERLSPEVDGRSL